jgi:HK97 family phage prohead protease
MENKTGLVYAEIKAADGAAGTFEAILSMATLDRDGEVIDPHAFDPLPPKITIDIDHGMSVRTVVASGEPRYDGDVLMFTGSFASTPLAQEVRTLVTEGHVDKMSVAFMNAVRDEDPTDQRIHIRRAELLNAAIVAIPSNREASILVAKAMAMADEDRLDSLLGDAVAAAIRSFMATPATETVTSDPEAAAAPAAAPPAPDVTKALAARARALLLLTE